MPWLAGYLNMPGPLGRNTYTCTILLFCQLFAVTVMLQLCSCPWLVSERQSPRSVHARLGEVSPVLPQTCHRLLMIIVSARAGNKLTLTKLGNIIIGLHFVRIICMSYSKPAVLAKSSAYKAECRPNSKPSGRPCNPPRPGGR